MSLKKRIVCMAIVFALTVLTNTVGIPLGAATEPSEIVLDYDSGSQTLAVNVSHSVANTKTHHVETIEVQKNSLSMLNRSYENQSFSWGMYDTFSVSASASDNLTVTVSCSRGDSLTASLIVESSTTTTTPPTGTTMTTTATTTEPTGTDSPTPLDVGFVGAVAAIVVVLLIVLLLLLMRFRPEYVPDALKQLASRIRAGTAWLWEKLRGLPSSLRSLSRR